MLKPQIDAAIKEVSKQTGFREDIISVTEIVFGAKHSITGKKDTTAFHWHLRHPSFSYSGIVIVYGMPSDDYHRVIVGAGISDMVKETMMESAPEACLDPNTEIPDHVQNQSKFEVIIKAMLRNIRQGDEGDADKFFDLFTELQDLMIGYMEEYAGGDPCADAGTAVKSFLNLSDEEKRETLGLDNQVAP